MSQWSQGLFGCTDNCAEFIYAWFCPHCAVASLRNNFDGSDWVFNCLCLTPCAARNLVREGYGIEGSCAEDILITWCCHPCVITQAAAEVTSRGAIQPFVANSPGEWQQGTWSCCDYPAEFIYAWFCPSCAAGSVYSAFDESKDCLFNCLCIGPCVIRNSMREAYGIEGNCAEDILCMWCCTPCAITQLHGEVQKRGPLHSSAPGVQGMQ